MATRHDLSGHKMSCFSIIQRKSPNTSHSVAFNPVISLFPRTKHTAPLYAMLQEILQINKTVDLQYS